MKEMIYRAIGKTDMSASVIGLGTEHLDGKPYETADEVIGAAMEHGVNIMDLFMPGETVRGNIGRALRGKRDKMLIQGHICSTDINEQYDRSRDLKTIRKYFENLLRCLDTDYIDFGMLFFIDSEKDYSEALEGDALRYALELKEKGVIRAIGASSHNPLVARRVVETGIVDLLMFSINPAFDMAPGGIDVLDYLGEAAIDYEKNIDSGRAALYRLCERKGVAITVMKTLGAGKLLSPKYTPFAKPLTVPQCIHYALTRPAVVSALVGYSNRREVLEALQYLDADEADKDYSAVIDKYQGDFKGNCVYCNHCLPCPSGINIAEVNKYFDIAVLDEANIPPGVHAHYKALEKHGADCISCGSCEKRCPFSVPVVKNMEKAGMLFGF
ncbi:MAG: aldo/keto reductase [Treponema sp.]|jgi:predicted aldo/keto reductase-like oxidoreductase|nr:aldo/keto reductase [Treponema sp.]